MPVRKNIFIFGNSITYGQWDEQGGWANRVRMHFDRPSLPLPKDYIITYNLGIPSDTSEGIAARLSTETQARLTPNPGVKNIQFIIATGANDSRWLIEEERVATSPDQFSKNFELITKAAQQFSNDIVFLGLLPCIEQDVLAAAKLHGWVEHFNNKSLSEYNDLIKQHCEKYGHKFVDVYSVFVKQGYDDLFSDGLHPNSKGHALIAEAVVEVINDPPNSP